MGIPAENCLCTSLQDIDWKLFADSLDAIVDVWTLSYLKPRDIIKVLVGAKVALKKSGVLIISLPVKLREASRAGH